MATFNYYTPTIKDIGIRLDNLLEVLHEEDSSPDNPIVCEVEEIFAQLPSISNIRGGYVILEDITCFPGVGEIHIASHVLRTSRKICKLMKGAEKIAIFICTAGQEFSDCAKMYNKQGEYLKGYIVDTMGSVTVEKSMDFIQSELAKHMQQEGMKITNRYSPGYCNWPVEDQKKLFSLLPAHACDIWLSDSCLMMPIKSVSGIIGIGKNVQKSSYSCDICNNLTCIYRKVKDKNTQY